MPSPTRPVTDGFVPWPRDTAERYRAEGFWAGVPLGDLPRRWAERDAGATALVDESGTVTFGELSAAVDAGAAALLSQGMRPHPHGDRVLVQLPNSIDLVVIVLSCLRAGVVPVLALPNHREAELTDLATRSEAVALVTTSEHRGHRLIDTARRVNQAVESVEALIVAGRPDAEPGPGAAEFWWDRIADGGHETTLPPIDASSVALLLLSGGTTGTPKLIARTHDDYVYNLRASAAACEWDQSTVFLAGIPVTHNFGLACPGVLGVLDAGGTAVLASSPKPSSSFAAIRRNGVTDAAVVPAVLQAWIDHARGSGETLPSLRRVQVGGARLAAEVAKDVRPVLGAVLQQALGMAEGLINYTRPGDSDDLSFYTQGRPVSPADEVRVVDSGMDTPHVGELWARGPYTIRGYWRAEEHNRVAFAPDGWYRSGDLVRQLDGGYLVVEGRIKDVINRAGEKISAEEIENALYSHEAVARVAVVAIPDQALGEKVAAVVVPRDDRPAPTLESLRDHVSSLGLAGFKRPEKLIVLDEMPLTKVGKIDRVTLRQYARQAETP